MLHIAEVGYCSVVWSFSVASLSQSGLICFLQVDMANIQKKKEEEKVIYDLGLCFLVFMFPSMGCSSNSKFDLDLYD